LLAAIPHYVRAQQQHGHLPSMGDPAYEEQMRAQQRAMVECVERGRWWESPMCESFTGLFLDLAARAKLFVDVGAEIGFYAYLAARCMPDGGKIIALEPDPVRCDLLRELLGLCERVRIIEAAASDSRGTCTLSKPRGCSATEACVEGESFEAATVALDELLAGQQVDLVKLDVEGAEARVLFGMRGLLAQGRAVVLLECHPWVEQVTPGGTVRMHELLHEANYRIFRTDRGKPEPADRLGGRCVLAPESLAVGGAFPFSKPRS